MVIDSIETSCLPEDPGWAEPEFQNSELPGESGSVYHPANWNPLPITDNGSKDEDIFQKDDFTKAQVVDAIKTFIPNFEHEEKGKNLDQKM